MTKASSAILADPLLARKGEAAPTGFRRAAALPADAANSNGTNGGDPGPEPSAAPEAPPLELGEQASLLTCVPLKASFVGLETAEIDEPAAPQTEDAGLKETAAALPSRAPQAEDSWTRRLLIVLALALVLFLGWIALMNLSEYRAPQEAASVTAPTAGDGEETAAAAATTTAPEVSTAAPASQPHEIPATAPQAIEPTFDVVRIEANGDAVIVGRGPAFSELVVLDNGTPIGTVTADAEGQWILIPDQPLNQGGHNFSLAVKSDSSTVILPEPGSREEAEPARPGAGEPVETPAEDDQSLLESETPSPSGIQLLADADSSAPLPLRKPALAATLGAEGKLNAYDIQMVSVPSVDGASREMRRLKQDFPEILANLNLRIDEKSYSDQRRRYRVRSGPFLDRTAAEALCARLNASQQDCLVLKR